MTDDRRHVGHPASLRAQISAQIQLSRIENEQVTESSQPSTQNREPTQEAAPRAANADVGPLLERIVEPRFRADGVGTDWVSG
jgi:hypothetical protein